VLQLVVVLAAGVVQEEVVKVVTLVELHELALALAGQPNQSFPPVAEDVESGVFLVLVEDELQDVDVLVQTGTETVHGQSVTVRVVLAETVYVLPAWTMVVAEGMKVVMAVTTVVVQPSGPLPSDQSFQL